MTKIEDATNEQLDVAVAVKVMEWELVRCTTGGKTVVGFDKAACRSRLVCAPEGYSDTPVWSPSTNIAHAFQVDKPEWRWDFEETDSSLIITLQDTSQPSLIWKCCVCISLDADNKVAAYCRGRCITALKACGVEEE